MYIHTFRRTDGQERYLLLDDNEEIVELPTRYACALASRTRYSKKSVVSFLKTIKYFCAYLKEIKIFGSATLDEALTTVGSMVVENWFMHQKMCGLKGTTLRHRDAVLKRFMDWLTTHEAGKIRSHSDSPYSDGKLKTAPAQRPAPKYLTYMEVAEFIRQGFHNESERCLAHFLYDTGVRVSEVSRILKNDLPVLNSYPDGVMYFPLLVRGSKGSGGAVKERYTIISRPMLERILLLHNNWRTYRLAQMNHKPDTMPVFLNVKGHPITAAAIQKQTYNASKRLSQSSLSQQRITPHSYRHGTALSILQSEHRRELLEKLVVCQRALGHASITTTEHYTRIPAPVLARMRELCSPHDFTERYQEAQYIREQTFKPQRVHTERRGHGKQTRNLFAR